MTSQTAELLSRVADANGETLQQILISTGINLHDLASVNFHHVQFLEDSYGADAAEVTHAVLADLHERVMA